jgi:3-deoxy-D-manno-octulosonic-acid transferase
VVQWAYRLLFTVGFFVMAPGYTIKMLRRGHSGRGFGQRFGFYGKRSAKMLEQARGGWWLHAVSVGEMNLAVLLVRELRRRDPGIPIVVSTTTVTGRAVGLAQLPSDVALINNPVDFRSVVRRAFDAIQPQALVLLESELWPNYLWEAAARQVPVALVNARLSERTEHRYRKALGIVGPLLRQMRPICVQCPEDFARMTGLSVEAEQIVDTGSMKYDVSLVSPAEGLDARQVMEQAGWRPGRPVFLAGSTHPGEEEIVARAWMALREKFPDLYLVLAPRHAERGGELADMLARMGLKCVRRSLMAPPGEGDAAASDILLLDSTGELRFFYKQAAVTFIGKSLVGRGGQNFLEPVQAGSAVLFGPEMQNFGVISRDFIKAEAVGVVRSGDDLVREAGLLLADTVLRERRVAQALQLFNQRLGATARTVDALGKLGVRPSSPRTSVMGSPKVDETGRSR